MCEVHSYNSRKKGAYLDNEKIEADCPDSWIFEEDIYIAVSKNYKRNKYKQWIITSLILSVLSIISYYFLAYYGGVKKAGRIIIGLEVSSILILYLTIWIVRKKILKKYWPIIVIPAFALFIVIVVISIYTKGNINLKPADILSFCGDYLTFLGTFCLGYFIYYQDRVKMIEEKRTKLRLLITLMENANIELLHLRYLVRNNSYIQIPENRKNIDIIPYNSDWILYYSEYETLKGENTELKRTLNAFFNNIMRVNTAIKNGKMEEANEINERYIDNNNYSTNKYNELEAFICLRDACNDHHSFNTRSWIERKETITLINELCRKYYYIIENYIYVWLLKNNVETTTEKDDLNREIVDWLLLNSPEIKEKFRFPDEKRIISKVVYDCSLKFSSKSKRINYVWGEYSLR